MLRSGGISKYVAGGGIRNGEGGGIFFTGNIVENLKSRWKQVPSSRCYMKTFGWWGRLDPLLIRHSLQEWDRLGIDFGRPVYIPSLAIYRMRWREACSKL